MNMAELKVIRKGKPITEFKWHELKTVKQKVLWLSKKHPIVIESYPCLIMMFWIYEGIKNKAIIVREDNSVWIDMDGIRKLTSPESITRAFRVMKEQGLIEEPPEIARIRREREKWFRLTRGLEL